MSVNANKKDNGQICGDVTIKIGDHIDSKSHY